MAVNLLKRRYRFKCPVKRIFVFSFDVLGFLFFYPFRRLRKKFDSGTLRRILVIRLDHLGDVIMTSPAIEALCRKYPNAEIDVLVSPESAFLFQQRQGISRVILFEHHWFHRPFSLGACFDEVGKLLMTLRKGHYDLGIDFRGDVRNLFLLYFSNIRHRLGFANAGGGFLTEVLKVDKGDCHQVELNLDLLEPLGIQRTSELSPIPVSKKQTQAFRAKIKHLLTEKESFRILIHPGAGVPSKRWPAESYHRLIERLLKETSAQIILIGTAQEKPIPIGPFTSERFLDFRGLTSLPDLISLMNESSLLIGNDSGPAHMAAAQGIPIIVLFSGTNRAKLWQPWTKQLHLIKYDVPCSPCNEETCPLRHHDCMKQITVEGVYEEVWGFLKAG